VVSTLLHIKRMLYGAKIDRIIADVQPRKAMAIEHWRRADWRKRELTARSFSVQCVHAVEPALPYLAPVVIGTLWIGWSADVPDHMIWSGPGVFLSPGAIFHFHVCYP
jgi:hypothetical protein